MASEYNITFSNQINGRALDAGITFCIALWHLTLL